MTLATRGRVRIRRIRASPSQRASVARCLTATAAVPTIGNPHPISPNEFGWRAGTVGDSRGRSEAVRTPSRPLMVVLACFTAQGGDDKDQDTSIWLLGFDKNGHHTLDQPDVTEVVVYLRAGQPDMTKSTEIRWNGIWDVRLNHPEWADLHLQHLILQGKRERAGAARDEPLAAALKAEHEALLEKLHAFHGPRWIYNSKYDLKTVPRLLLTSIEVEGPVAKEWPPVSHRALGLSEQIPETAEGVRDLFARFLPRVYRRPVATEEVDRIVQVVATARDRDEANPTDALRLGLQTVLCSPGFLYIAEPSSAGGPRPLNGHELASRLSYFLWATLPDDELTALAASGKLSDSEVLKTQATRMLDDPRIRRFVEGFAGQWLDVRQYGTVMPAHEYKAYDKDLEEASKKEPLAFFQHILQNNLPIATLLDSDFLRSGKGVRNRCCVFGGGLGDGRGPARSRLGCGCAALVVSRA